MVINNACMYSNDCVCVCVCVSCSIGIVARKIQLRAESAVKMQKYVRMFLAMRKHRPRWGGGEGGRVQEGGREGKRDKGGREELMFNKLVSCPGFKVL